MESGFIGSPAFKLEMDMY